MAASDGDFPRPAPLPPGIPTGYVAIELLHKTGLTKLVFDSQDGRHKQLSARKVFRAEAEKNGLPLEEGDAFYAEFRCNAEADAAEHQRRFVDAFGGLGAAQARHLPGWTCLRRGEARRDRWTYISPGGARRCAALADVEAYLGEQMAEGGRVDALVAAADAALRKARAARRPGRHERAAPRKRRGPWRCSQRQLQRWRRFLYVGERRVPTFLPMAGASRGSADEQLAQLLSKRARTAPPSSWARHSATSEAVQPEVAAPGSQDEQWIRTHPLWIKMVRRGYPLPISEREILALRAFTPKEFGGTADLRYC